MVYVILQPTSCYPLKDPLTVSVGILAIFRNDWKTVLFLRKYLKREVKVNDLPSDGECKTFYPITVCNAYSDL